MRIVPFLFGFFMLFCSPLPGGPIASLILYRVESIGYGFDIFEIFLAVLVLVRILQSPKLVFLQHARKLYFSVVLVMVSRLMSLLYADQPYIGQYVSFLRYIEVFAAIFVFQSIALSKKELSSFLLGLLCGTVIEAVGDIFVAYQGQRGMFISFTAIAFQVFFLVYFLLLFLEKKKWKYVLLVSFFVLSLIATQTRTFFINAALSAIFALWFVRKQVSIQKAVISFIILISFGGAVIHLFPDIYERTFERSMLLFDPSSGSGVRYFLWDKAFGAFLENPLLGIGSGGFARNVAYLPQYFNVLLPGDYAEMAYANMGTHSTITNVMAETGVVGMLAYFVWIFAIFSLFRKVVPAAINSKDSSLILALVASCAATILSDLWTVGSFGMVSSCLIGLLLGWMGRQPDSIGRA